MFETLPVEADTITSVERRLFQGGESSFQIGEVVYTKVKPTGDVKELKEHTYKLDTTQKYWSYYS